MTQHPKTTESSPCSPQGSAREPMEPPASRTISPSDERYFDHHPGATLPQNQSLANRSLLLDLGSQKEICLEAIVTLEDAIQTVVKHLGMVVEQNAIIKSQLARIENLGCPKMTELTAEFRTRCAKFDDILKTAHPAAYDLLLGEAPEMGNLEVGETVANWAPASCPRNQLILFDECLNSFQS